MSGLFPSLLEVGERGEKEKEHSKLDSLRVSNEEAVSEATALCRFIQNIGDFCFQLQNGCHLLS